MAADAPFFDYIRRCPPRSPSVTAHTKPGRLSPSLLGTSPPARAPRIPLGPHQGTTVMCTMTEIDGLPDYRLCVKHAHDSGPQSMATSPRALKLERELGRGNFGTVVRKAVAVFDLTGTGEKMLGGGEDGMDAEDALSAVAVKTALKEALSTSECRAMAREVDIHSDITARARAEAKYFAAQGDAMRGGVSSSSSSSSSSRLGQHGTGWAHVLFLRTAVATPKAWHLVLDLCCGGTLDDYLRRFGPEVHESEAHVRDIFSQLTGAVRWLHDAAAVCHCDIKPANILVRDPFVRAGRGGQDCARSVSPSLAPIFVKLGDFGSARRLRDMKSTNSEFVGGTSGFLAPETMRREGVGAGIDIWVLGIMCFTMAVGYAPFFPAGACLTDPLRFEEREWKHKSAACRDFVEALLRKNPKERLTARQASQHPWLRPRDAEAT